MAATTNVRLNIIEWSKHFHRGKVIPDVALLAQDNQMVMDIPFVECNDGTTHLYSLTTKLPTVSKTRFGGGTPESKSGRAQERENCVMISGFSSVEEKMSKVGGSAGQVMAKEDVNFAEAMKQGFAQALLYGNRTSDVDDINGFATRYSSLTGTKSANVFSCAGASANAQTSIYGVNWGPDVYGIFPEGLTAGYQRNFLGRNVTTLANGNRLVELNTEHNWNFGLVIEHWASAGRICNIQTADAQALTNNQAPTSFANILHKMTLLLQRLNRRPGKKVLYANDTVHALMMRLGLEKSSNGFTVREAVTQFGTFEELRYLNTPIRRSDRILLTEGVVS